MTEHLQLDPTCKVSATLNSTMLGTMPLTHESGGTIWNQTIAMGALVEVERRFAPQRERIVSGMVVCACNPRDLGGRDRRITTQGQPEQS
jgi:hypothetical protein